MSILLLAVVIAGGWGCSKLTDVDSVVTSATVVVVVVEVDVKEEGRIWSSSYGPNYQKIIKIKSGANYLQPKPVVNSVKAGDCKIVGVVESGSTMESGSLLWPKIHSSAASKAFVFVLS